MGFDEALVALKMGRRVARGGWANQWLMLTRVTPYPATVQHPAGMVVQPQYQPHIDLFGVGAAAVPWSMPHEDVLAEDWAVL